MPVDHRALADAYARPQIAFQQRWQGAQRFPRIDRLLGHEIHLDILRGDRAHAHSLGHRVVMVQIGQWQRQRCRVGSRERGAAEHQIGGEARHIDHQPAPQQLHGGVLAAISLENAGTAEFQKVAVGRHARQHRRNVVFRGGVEPAGAGGVNVAHQPVGADHGGLPVLVGQRAVDHQEMIANLVELVEIAARFAHGRRRQSGHFLVEDAVAQALRRFDLEVGFGEAHFHRTRGGQNGPLLKAAFKGARLVNVDHWRRFPWTKTAKPSGVSLWAR